MTDLIETAAEIDNAWSLAAFAIAAALVVLKMTLASNAATQRGRKGPPAALASPAIWPIVIAICVLAALPILADVYVRAASEASRGVYRLTVTVLDPQGKPVSGARLRTTVAGESMVTSQGAGVIVIPRATLPSDGAVTVHAELASAFLHGSTSLRLADDYNPAVTIALEADRSATVAGIVQDERGRAIPDAVVTVIGAESGTTSRSGAFSLKAKAAAGQMIRIHVEKDGYRPVDHDHPAGDQSVVVVMPTDKR